MRLFSHGGGGRDGDDDDAWRCVVFRNATPKEEEEEEEKDIARCRFDLRSKICDEKKRRKKGEKKRELSTLGFRVYLEKEKKGETRRLSLLSSKRTQKFYRFCSRALHAPTHQHHHLQQNPHSMASFRVRSLLSFASGERRDGRAVRVVFLSLSFSRFFTFLSDDSRDSDGRSRPRVRSCRGKGCAVDERDEKGRGPRELRRVDIERRVFARPRRGRPSRRSVRGLVFQDLSRAKIVTAKGNSSTRKKWEGGKNCRAEKTRRRVDATTSTRRFERSRARR